MEAGRGFLFCAKKQVPSSYNEGTNIPQTKSAIGQQRIHHCNERSCGLAERFVFFVNETDRSGNPGGKFHDGNAWVFSRRRRSGEQCLRMRVPIF